MQGHMICERIADDHAKAYARQAEIHTARGDYVEAARWVVRQNAAEAIRDDIARFADAQK